ncbi:MAG TPA: hypothetical protein VKM54_22255 [Myxococcota bacterium]|nr:hypothetical protein [Myxococcota bacterium]
MSEAECSQLKGRIERDGHALCEAFESLRRAAVAEIDPRERVRAHPIAWLAGALLLGMFLGTRR